VGGGRQVAGGSHRLVRFSSFLSGFSVCFETALCLNTILPFINILALLRESYTLTPISD
jgi:hypothetical protein